MKKTFATIASAFLMVISFSSFAILPYKSMEAKTVLSYYVEAVTLGSDLYHQYMLADDFEYRNTANQDVHNRKAFLRFLKANKGYTFNTETTYDILDLTGKSCLAKATIKFEHFTRVDHITMSNTQEGWKISKIVTTYEDK